MRTPERVSSAISLARARASWTFEERRRIHRPYTEAPTATTGTTRSITPVSVGDIHRSTTTPPSAPIA